MTVFIAQQQRISSFCSRVEMLLAQHNDLMMPQTLLVLLASLFVVTIDNPVVFVVIFSCAPLHHSLFNQCCLYKIT